MKAETAVKKLESVGFTVINNGQVYTAKREDQIVEFFKGSADSDQVYGGKFGFTVGSSRVSLDMVI